jgi:N-acetylmuramoyl-L-alanine amidase
LHPIRRFRRSHAALILAAAAGAAIVALAVPVSFAQQPTYTLVAANGRRPLPFRSSGSTDLMPLDQLATVFDFRVQDDPQAGGVIVIARGQRVLLTPGQALVSTGGRIVSLSGPVVREGQALFVPVDFLSRALGPALNQRIDVRRGSRLVILGDLRVPQITPRVERAGQGARLSIDVQPPAPHRTAREGARLVIHFEADALDLGTTTGAAPEFLGPARVEGPTLSFDLGTAAANVRPDDTDPAHVVVDVSSAAAPASPASAPAPAPAAPTGPAPAGRGAPPPVPVEPPAAADISASGGLRTVAIDPGHGGDDAGAHGSAGTVEKDLTMQLARRLKGAIESRMGLRVLLTREGDEAVPVDRRTAIANNNKADLLISIHANASFRPSSRGAQVLSLSLDDYKDRARGLPVSLPVPVVSGGTRVIDAMPWDLAQIPHAAASGVFAELLVKHLTERNVPLYPRSRDQAPLRVLVGANMPAVLVEVGFLSNADDEKALSSADLPGSIVEALLVSVGDVRGGFPAAPPTAR